jgi:hypothetical protein
VPVCDSEKRLDSIVGDIIKRRELLSHYHPVFLTLGADSNQNSSQWQIWDDNKTIIPFTRSSTLHFSFPERD